MAVIHYQRNKLDVMCVTQSRRRNGVRLRVFTVTRRTHSDGDEEGGGGGERARHPKIKP